MRASILALALGACGFSISSGAAIDASGDGSADGSLEDGAIDSPTDGPTPDVPTTMGWTTPQQLGISNADDPTLTADLREIWFDRGGDIYHATRPNLSSSFGAETLVAELSMTAATTPEVSSNGLSITLGVLTGNYDIYISSRSSLTDPWNPPIVVQEVNTVTHEAAAVISADRTMMALTSWRQAPQTSADIFISTRTSPSDAWGTPVYNAELSSSVQDGSVFLSNDKLTVCFDSLRGGTSLDIYCSTRSSPTATFPTPQPLTEINTPMAGEEDPWLTPDGKVLVFFSDRGGIGRLWYSTRP